MDVTISQSYYDPLFTGTNLTITCDITLSNLVDIPVIVSNVWTRDGSEINENTIMGDFVKLTDLSYTTSLEYYPLNSFTDDGQYKCLVKVIPKMMDDFEYLTNRTNSASTVLDVFGKFFFYTSLNMMYTLYHLLRTKLLRTRSFSKIFLV